MNYSLFICTTPRSGSTFLSDALKQTDVAGNPAEWLHDYLIEKTYSDANIRPDSPREDKINAIIKRATNKQGVFALKTMFDVFPEFLESVSEDGESIDQAWEAIAPKFKNPKFLFWKRRNKVRQAISYCKAHQSGLWHSDDDKKILDEDYIYRREDIDKIIYYFTKQETDWEAFFKRHQIEPITFYYENFVKDYQSSVLEILKHWELHTQKPIALTANKRKKVSTPSNQYWEELYRSKACWRIFPKIRLSLEPNEIHGHVGECCKIRIAIENTSACTCHFYQPRKGHTPDVKLHLRWRERARILKSQTIQLLDIPPQLKGKETIYIDSQVALPQNAQKKYFFASIVSKHKTWVTLETQTQIQTIPHLFPTPKHLEGKQVWICSTWKSDIKKSLHDLQHSKLIGTPLDFTQGTMLAPFLKSPPAPPASVDILSQYAQRGQSSETGHSSLIWEWLSSKPYRPQIKGFLKENPVQVYLYQSANPILQACTILMAGQETYGADKAHSILDIDQLGWLRDKILLWEKNWEDFFTETELNYTIISKNNIEEKLGTLVLNPQKKAPSNKEITKAEASIPSNLYSLIKKDRDDPAFHNGVKPQTLFLSAKEVYKEKDSFIFQIDLKTSEPVEFETPATAICLVLSEKAKPENRKIIASTPLTPKIEGEKSISIEVPATQVRKGQVIYAILAFQNEYWIKMTNCNTPMTDLDSLPIGS